jgi:hypothetical protein
MHHCNVLMHQCTELPCSRSGKVLQERISQTVLWRRRSNLAARAMPW